MKGYRLLRPIDRTAKDLREVAGLNFRESDEDQLTASTTIIPFPDDLFGGPSPRNLGGGPSAADSTTQGPSLTAWDCTISVLNNGAEAVYLVWGSWPLNEVSAIWADLSTFDVPAGETREFTQLSLTNAPFHLVVANGGADTACVVTRGIRHLGDNR